MDSSGNLKINFEEMTIQNLKVFQWWDYPVFFVLSLITVGSIFNVLTDWFTLKDWGEYPVTYFALTLLLLISLVNFWGRWSLLWFMRKPEPIDIKTNWKVAVVTSFVPHSEPIEMLEETLRSLVALEYPHDTWVLDEDDHVQVKNLCHRLGVNHFSRKNLPQFQTEKGMFQSRSKHGNYNAWLNSIGFKKYDIISAFDPDHIPKKNFLAKVLGYFEAPKTGYVQVAQAYYNQDAGFIARGAAEETYDYYSTIQMASYAMDYPIIIGSHNTHRVTALKEVGGFAPHDADDLLLTLFYRDHKWKGVYLPEILARGLTPVDWPGYLIQQRRWARSVLDLKFRCYPKIAPNLTLKSKIMSFLHGFNYIYRSITYPVILTLLTILLLTGNTPVCFSWEFLQSFGFLWGVIGICEFYRQRFYLDWKKEKGMHWRAGLLQFAKWPYMLLAIWDVFVNHRPAYEMTAKVKSGSKQFLLKWPNFFVFGVLGSSFIYYLIENQSVNPVIVLTTVFFLFCSFGLVLTEFFLFPEPYPKDTQRKKSHQEN